MGKSKIKIVSLSGEPETHDAIYGQDSFALTIKELALLYAKKAEINIVMPIHKKTLANFFQDYLFINSLGRSLDPDFRFFWQINIDDNFDLTDYQFLLDNLRKLYFSAGIKIFDSTLQLFRSINNNKQTKKTTPPPLEECSKCLSKNHCKQGAVKDKFFYSANKRINKNFCNFIHLLNIFNQELLCYDNYSNKLKEH